jgi:sporulation protein YlmC with PRC-barrel domain
MDEKREGGTGQSNQPGVGNRPGDMTGRSPGPAQRSRGSSGSAAGQDASSGGGLAGSVSDAAQRAYEQGEEYARRAGERYPEARRYYEEGSRAVGQQVAEAPLLSLLAVGAVAYGLGWMIHGGQSSRRQETSDRARTRRDRPGVRTGKPLIESDRVEGTAVYDREGRQIGTIERLMIEKISGRVAYAVMSFGGFFGLGAEEYAVPWNKLDYDKNLEGYRTDITKEQLRNAPSFSKRRDNDWADRQREQELHDYYQVTYYWVVP